jgi:hypothetical protein
MEIYMVEYQTHWFFCPFLECFRFHGEFVK